MISRANNGADGYSYSTHLWGASKLRALVRKRKILVGKLDGQLDTYQSKRMLENVNNEDALLINILMAMTAIDGIVYKSEKGIIRKLYKQIMLVLPDEKVRNACLSHANKSIEQILSKLKVESGFIHADIKKRIFLSALDVEVAIDRYLHKDESVTSRR